LGLGFGIGGGLTGKRGLVVVFWATGLVGACCDGCGVLIISSRSHLSPLTWML
jgi:hypothetical protein